MYVIRPLFDKFQKELVAFSNTSYGRDFISAFGGKEIKENYPVVKVTPDSIHQQIDKNTYRAVFYSRSPYIKKFAEVLTMMDIAEYNNFVSERKELVIPHYLGETNLLKNELPRIYLLQKTFNPDGNPETTSVDGTVATAAGGQSWSGMVAAEGNVSLDSGNTYDYFFLSDTTSNQWTTLTRVITLFDTSSLTGSATILNATYSLYQTTTFTNTYGGAVCMVNSSPASNTALVNSDYANVGTTQQASDINMSSISQSAYNDWTLNATGIGNISKSSITKFGSRFSFDREDSSPTWQNTKRNQLNFNSTETGSNIPKLVVNYSSGASFLLGY